ncbi:MAG: phosphatase PAP2 family protein, partial [Chitinophagales bacterium]
IIRDNIYFYFPWLIWSIVLLGYILTAESKLFSLWINKQHTQAGDIFFKYATWLGDGLVVGFLCVLLLFVQYRAALLAITVSVINLVLTGLLKQYFGYPRPAQYFEGMELNFVDGVDTYYHLSFPSGHTSAAFSIYLVLAILNAKKQTGLFFLLLAAIVAISRVYLMQHFVEDVLFGAFIGVSVATVVSYYMLRKPLSPGVVWGNSLLSFF